MGKTEKTCWPCWFSQWSKARYRAAFFYILSTRSPRSKLHRLLLRFHERSSSEEWVSLFYINLIWPWKDVGGKIRGLFFSLPFTLIKRVLFKSPVVVVLCWKSWEMGQNENSVLLGVNVASAICIGNIHFSLLPLTFSPKKVGSDYAKSLQE